MTQPTFAQARAISTAGGGLISETLNERLISLLAMLASGQNPDASAFTRPISGSVSSLPLGTPISASSGNVAAATATATLLGTTGKTTYITGFEITGLGATAGSGVLATVVGVVGGTMTFVVPVVAGVLLGNPPIIIPFTQPIPATTTNTDIVVSVPSFGTGNTNAAVVAHGFQL